jgi:hypothetical protein
MLPRDCSGHHRVVITVARVLPVTPADELVTSRHSVAVSLSLTAV